MSQNSNPVGKIYIGVIEEVINSVREAFADEGVDEQILQELKQSWDRRLRESKVLEPAPSTDTVPGPSPGAGGGASTASNSAPNNTSNNVGTNSGNSGNSSNSGNSKAKKDNPMMTAGQQSRNWQPQPSLVAQLDGPHDSSDEDGDDDEDIDNDDDRDENDDEQNDEENEGEDDQPLGSSDDVSDEDPEELFETEHVVVCQYDKITRSRNKWKFHLKDGIMNIKQRDYVFQKAVGDAEW